MLLFLFSFFLFLLKCEGFFTFFPAHINHIHARYKVGDSFYDPYIAKVVCSISLKWCHFPPIIASPLPPSSHLSSISSFPALLPLDAGLPSHPPIYTRKTARIDTHTAHVGGSASSFPYSPYYPLLLTNFTFFILSLLQKKKWNNNTLALSNTRWLNYGGLRRQCRMSTECAPGRWPSCRRAFHNLCDR